MIIRNRIKKPFSDKLFCELCLFCLLISGENRAYLYVLNKKTHKAKRTLYRYAEDLKSNGIVPNISIKKEEKYEYFYIPSIREQYISEHDFIQTFLKDYILNQKAICKTTNMHKEKLYRLCLLIIENVFNFWNVEYLDEEENKHIYSTLIDGKLYAFISFDIPNNLYKNLSKRTKQREVMITKRVISHMYEV